MGGDSKASKATGGAAKSDYPQLAPGPVGQRISNIYKERISQFYSGGQWDQVNLLSHVNPSHFLFPFGPG